MPKPDKPLLSFGARGTIAGSLTFQKRNQATIARTKPTPTDPKSPAQLAQRQRYKDAIAVWHALTPEAKEAWRGVCPGLTAYQCFLRSELKYVPPPPPIDIGAEAIDRDQYTAPGRTYILLDNPANATGVIDTIELWAYSSFTGLKVATFYLLTGTTYKCRDPVTIGDVPSGSKQIFTGLSIDVEAGDLIGFHAPSGLMERTSFGFAGLLWISGDLCYPGHEAEYNLDEGDVASLYGTGQAPP